MKKVSILLTLFLVVFGLGNAIAKTARHRAGKTSSHAKKLGANNISAILQKQDAQRIAQNGAAAKTTIATERLIAYSDYDYSPADTTDGPLGLKDSTHYVYSGTRGSQFNSQLMDYYSINFAPYSPDNLLQLSLYGEGYFGSDFMPGYASGAQDVKYDTGYIYGYVSSGSSGSVFGLYGINTNTYDANDNVLVNKLVSLYIPGTTYILTFLQTYGPANNLLGSKMVLDYADAIDTTAITTCFYNAAHQLVKDSISEYGDSVYAPFYVAQYTYNSAGNLSTAEVYDYSESTSEPYNRYDFFYNPDNTLRKDSASAMDAGTWKPDEVDSFIYTPGTSYFTGIYTVYYNSDSSIEVDFTSKHLNPAGLADTLWYSSYDTVAGSSVHTYPESTKDVFTYDAAGNPTADYTYFETDSAVDHIKYYYYNSILAVTNVQPAAPSCSIYPNPAINQVNITRTGITNSTTSYIRIMNMNGQVVGITQTQWQGSAQSVSLVGLADGMYWLQIQDEGSNVSHIEKIIKQ